MNTSLKTLFRRLWRHRLFTGLHVLGLAIGISSCWVIYRLVSYEFSFERKLPNSENIYRLVTGFVIDGKGSYSGGVSAPLYQAIREQVTGVNRVVPVVGMWMNTQEIKQSGKNPLPVKEPKNIMAVDTAYFAMVPYTWLAGNKTTALQAPENVVLTESRARSYFSGVSLQDMLGQTITYNDTLHKTVTGIVKDLDYPTEFTGREFLLLAQKEHTLNAWSNTNGNNKLYLQIDQQSDTARVMAQIKTIITEKMKAYHQENKPLYNFTRWFELVPLRMSHFSTHIGDSDIRKVSKPVMYGLIGVAGFLLLLACINYINLSTAQVPQRTKEIGVRKTLGSSRWSLIRQLLTETGVTVLLAAALAILLSKLAFGLLENIIPASALQQPTGPAAFLFIAFLLTVVTGLSGWYPARLIAKVQAVSIMRGQGTWAAGHNRNVLRKSLIVFQFVIAQLFIIGAVITGAQMNYTLKKDVGFNKEAVVLVNVPSKIVRNKQYKDKQFALADELRKQSGIQALSLGAAPMTNNFSSSEFEYRGSSLKEPIKRQVFYKWVDTAYLDLYNLKLLAGRNLYASDTTNEYVINETAMKAFGFSAPQEALGKMIGPKEEQYPVVGVVKDFHQRDFHKTIDPLVLTCDKSSLNTFNIKLNGTDPAQWQQTLKTIEQKWYAFYPPESFTVKFYDEALEAMYKDERNLSKLINLATTIAIIISCLGLFGLVTLTAFQRTKEIGIRKVLGASVTGIVRLLSSEFIKLVLIALVIASPIAWWAMNKWLQDFAYRIHIEWWMFGLTGLATIMIALFTVSFQAMKAALANPVKSLRSE
jgi:putative ABC transport system permease protein